MASTRPNSDKVLIEKPKPSITAKVPMIDTGTASSGMIDARQVCRKMITTSTTRATASSRVWMTALIDSCTNWVGSYTTLKSTPSGKSFFSSAILARTSADSCSALAPGASKIAIAAADLLFSSERREYEFEPSSMRATSRRWVMAPSDPVRTMMSPNSSTLVRRPWVLTVSWNSEPFDGDAPITPAATCTFCSRTAATMSDAVMPRAATFCGSSQTRMA